MIEHASQIEITVAALYEPLYRLALLVTGSEAHAARQIERAGAMLTAQTSDVEHALLRGLLPKVARYGRWQPGAVALQRAQINSAQASAILNMLARRAPAIRLAIGMHYLRGLSSADVQHVLGSQMTSDAAIELARFRADAAIALGGVAPDADSETLVQLDQALDGALDEQDMTELRGRIFADDALRAQRDGIVRIRGLLPQILPGMFAVAAPASLLARLNTTPAPVRRPRPRYLSPRAAIGALVAAVLLISALIVVLPGLPRTSASAVSRTAPDLLEAAIHRFEQPPLARGVLHERYRIEETGRAAQIIERWYDYGSPSRLAVDVRRAGSEQPQFGIRADGLGRVQYRLAQSQSNQSPTNTQLDYQMSAAQAQAALPALRGMLLPNRILGNPRNQSEISGLYLAQARTLGATLLGRTSADGRDAWLLRYTTDRLPNERAVAQQRQVLLTIDAQVYALLGVTVLADGAGESTTYQPWHAEVVEVLDEADASQFVFAQPANVQTVDGTHSVLLPTIPTTEFTSLLDAQQRSEQPLLAPQTPPDGTRGIVLALDRGTGGRFGLLYEGEFQSLMIFPGDMFARTTATALEQEEHTIGAYRYRFATATNYWRGGMLAIVYRPEAPEERTSVLLMDAYATPDERAEHLRSLLASLAPVTAANVDTFSAQFVAVSRADG